MLLQQRIFQVDNDLIFFFNTDAVCLYTSLYREFFLAGTRSPNRPVSDKNNITPKVILYEQAYRKIKKTIDRDIRSC